MGEFTRIMARDGHEFDVWLAPPVGTPRAITVRRAPQLSPALRNSSM
mgnify:CR=1 FL=1